MTKEEAPQPMGHVEVVGKSLARLLCFQFGRFCPPLYQWVVLGVIYSLLSRVIWEQFLRPLWDTDPMANHAVPELFTPFQLIAESVDVMAWASLVVVFINVRTQLLPAARSNPGRVPYWQWFWWQAICFFALSFVLLHIGPEIFKIRSRIATWNSALAIDGFRKIKFFLTQYCIIFFGAACKSLRYALLLPAVGFFAFRASRGTWPIALLAAFLVQEGISSLSVFALNCFLNIIPQRWIVSTPINVLSSIRILVPVSCSLLLGLFSASWLRWIAFRSTCKSPESLNDCE